MTLSVETPSKPQSRRPLILVVLVLLALGVVGLWYSGAFGQERPKIAMVTAADNPYWERVIVGAQDAARMYDVDLTVVRVKPDAVVQYDAVQDLLKSHWDGMAISPVSPTMEANLLSSVANATTLVTYDSDMPISRRLCFVGTDNYAAGRACGDLIRRALPEGGEIIASIPNPDKDNVQRRRQGMIDELLDRSTEPMRPADPIGAPLVGSKYTIAATLVDAADPENCTKLAIQAIKDHPNVKCFVGLQSYNAPALVKALQDAGKVDQIKVIGFDVSDDTLANIDAGHIYGTMMQDQYGCGYHAIRILAENARHVTGGLPLFQTLTLGCDAITKDNVDAARARLSAHQPSTQPTPSQT